MDCGIIAKIAKGWIICLNVYVCYKLITLLLFDSLHDKASLIKPCLLQIQAGCSLISILGKRECACTAAILFKQTWLDFFRDLWSTKPLKIVAVE